MPKIRPSADLRNKYGEISDFCHKYGEPVYITKNGTGDLAVMSIETYEKLIGRYQLYQMLDAGLEDIRNGNTHPMEEVFDDLEERIKHEL
ncbi:type II toxin-antitoxin system Phd/YefM family antitoxin [Emergencia sp.]|uniref:type II toxin-antitoxin system Phd/YefM family antitoxin n=1 Tax=Emergencia sp. TaxID=1926557 RepID=UPI003AEF5754